MPRTRMEDWFYREGVRNGRKRERDEHSQEWVFTVVFCSFLSFLAGGIIDATILQYAIACAIIAFVLFLIGRKRLELIAAHLVLGILTVFAFPFFLFRTPEKDTSPKKSSSQSPPDEQHPVLARSLSEPQLESTTTTKELSATESDTLRNMPPVEELHEWELGRDSAESLARLEKRGLVTRRGRFVSLTDDGRELQAREMFSAVDQSSESIEETRELPFQDPVIVKDEAEETEPVHTEPESKPEPQRVRSEPVVQSEAPPTSTRVVHPVNPVPKPKPVPATGPPRDLTQRPAGFLTTIARTLLIAVVAILIVMIVLLGAQLTYNALAT